MSEDELLGLVDQHIIQSVGYIGGTLSEQRRQAMQYYLGEPFGDEQEGRSQVMLTDVQDTVEWMLPSLIEIFVSNDKAVQFTPVGEEDVQAAEQETDYVNHVFYKDNEGFNILYTWFKDALLSKNGLVKAVARHHQTVNNDEYEGLTEIQLAELGENAELDFLAVSEQVDETTGQITFNCTVRRTRDKKRIHIEPIPPEQFLISRRSASIEEAEFVGQRLRKSQSELILMGYDPEIVQRLPSHDEEEYNEERYTRFVRDEEYPYAYEGGVNHAASREIWITECYFRADYDGDGIAELRKIVVAGTGNNELLENEVWDHERPPFYDICPTPITHKFFGLSVADLTMDIQRIRSVLLRQMLDAQYLANNPRHSVVQTEVNLDDMLVSRPGGLVRITRPEAHPQPLLTQPPQQTTYNLFEFMTGERESRTGVSRYTQGLDPGSLNDTASGINQLMTAAQMRVKLIARLFAENGVKKLFLGIHELVRKHQDVGRTIRLRNRWIEVDPTSWQERTDLTVEVGLGTGNKEAQLLHLDSLGQAQAAIIQVQGGVNGPIVHARHVYNLMEKKAELAGFKQPDLFASDPDDPQNQPEPQQPQPDPDVIKLQADMQKARLELQAKQAESAAKLQQAADEAADKIQLEYDKLAVQRQEHQDEMALSYAQLGMEQEAKAFELAAQRSEREAADEAKFSRDSELLRQKSQYDAQARNAEGSEQVRGGGKKQVEVVRGKGGKISGAKITDEGGGTKNVKINRGADGRIEGAVVT